MKKLIVTILTVLASGSVYALPVGNPSEASLLCDGLFFEGDCCPESCDPCWSWCDVFSLRAGFYGDYVFNRHLEFDIESRSNIDDTELFTNAGYLALNLCDRFDIFATLGTTHIFFESGAIDFGEGLGSERFQLDTDSHFSWSVGARATLWQCGCTSLGIEGQYFRTNPYVRRFGVTSANAYPDFQTQYREWQVGLGVSHRINLLVPYIAVKWSKANWNLGSSTFVIGEDVEVEFDNLRVKNSKRWGYEVGVSLVDCEKAAVTVAGRFGDEKALYVNGQVRF